MSHLRSALLGAVYALALLTAFLTFTVAEGDARAAAAPVVIPVSATSVDPLVERELAAREKRISRSVARRKERPARVERRVVIEKITWTSPLASYRLTGRFGDRSYLWSSGMHTGLDFAAPSGTPIRSIAAGTVKSASYDGSYGYKTVVTLPGGGEVWYCHQSRLAVTLGQKLAPGQLLGYVGTTGNVTGAHLHMEVHRGSSAVDPAGVLAAQGVGL